MIYYYWHLIINEEIIIDDVIIIDDRNFFEFWYNESNFIRRAFFFWWKFASNIRENYEIEINNYIDNCVILNEDSSFSIDIHKLNDWINSLKIRDFSHLTTQKYFCHLRFYYTNLNYFKQNIEMFSHFMLIRQCFDIKRRVDETNIVVRRFIIKDLLLKLLDFLDIHDENQMNLYAVFCLIYVVFLKMNEFTYKQTDASTSNFNDWFVIKNSIIFHDNFLILRLSTFKCDIFRRDVDVHIAESLNNVDSINVMKMLWLRFSVIITEVFLFKKFKDFFKQYIIVRLQNMFDQLKMKEYYTKYSFRRKTII